MPETWDKIGNMVTEQIWYLLLQGVDNVWITLGYYSPILTQIGCGRGYYKGFSEENKALYLKDVQILEIKPVHAREIQNLLKHS